MNKIIKSLTAVLILMTAFILVACTDASAVIASAKEELGIEFAGTDTLESVTQDLELPESLDEVVITWSSANTAVIGNDGTVTRGAADVSVVITATLTFNGINDTKNFTVVVKALPALADAAAVAAAKNTLAVGFATGDSATNVTQNLTLPATVGDVAVVWSSNTLASLSNAGVVVRGLTDVNVVLTATLTKNNATDTKTFNLVIKLDQDLVDEQTVETAKASLAIGFAAGDSLNSVKGNVTLPASVGDVAVTWASNTPATISNAGVVVRGEADVTVVLTATLTKGTQSDTKQFSLVVKTAPSALLADAIDALNAHYAATLVNPEFEAVADLTLLAKISDIDIVWTTSMEAVIDATGKVTQPAWQADSTGQAVTLTASLTLEDETETVDFLVFVPNLAKTIEQRLNEVLNIVTAFPAVEGISANQTFKTSQSYDDLADLDPAVVYTITWVSDKPESLSNTGVISRPAAGQPNVSVTMTASITYEGVTVEREVVFNVLAYAESSKVVDSIAALYDEQKGTYVKLNGVTVIGKTGAGVYVYDGTQAVYIYDSTVIAPNLVYGQTYDIEGVYDLYFSAPQLIHDASTPLTAVLSEEEPAGLIGLPGGVHDAVDGRVPPTDDNPFVYGFYEMTAKVVVDNWESATGASNNYNTFLVPVDYAGSTVIDQTKSPDHGTSKGYLTPDVLVVYYQSPNKAAVEALNGQVVTLNILLIGWRTDRNIFYGLFFGTALDIEISGQSDADAVAAAKASIQGSLFQNEYPSATTLNLPSTGFGATITWESNNEAVINSDTGVVTPVEGVQTSVTLTATITKGAVSDTATKVIKVGELPLIDIADAKLITSGSVRVVGTITAYQTNRTFMLQDESGAIALYVATAEVAAFQALIGREVEVIGTRGAFQGLLQINASVAGTINLGVGDVYAPVVLDPLDLTGATLLADQSKLVSISNLEVVSVTIAAANFDNTTIVLKNAEDETITMFWDSRVLVGVTKAEVLAHFNTLEAGDIVNIVGMPLGWVSETPRLQFVSISQLVEVVNEPATDEGKVAAAGAELEVPANATANLTLPETGLWGTTIVWESNNAAITAAGVVTRGESDVEVILTAIVTSGEFSDEFTFNVTVKALTVETLSYDFNFGTLATNTSYVTTPTDASPTNLVVEGAALDWTRLNANISNQASSGTGIVLGIRSGNSWGSPYLQTKTAVAGATKVEFVVSNWTTDAVNNISYATNIYVQVSTNGTDWTNVQDFYPTWNTAASANNTLTVTLPESAEPVFIRLFVQSAGTQTGTFSLRLIVLSAKIWTA